MQVLFNCQSQKQLHKINVDDTYGITQECDLIPYKQLNFVLKYVENFDYVKSDNVTSSG